MMSKTYTEKRIELGQDLNNTWHLLSALATAKTINAEELETMFRSVFPVIRSCSEWARAQAEQEVRTP